ncbi:DUF4386 family protein [Muricauda sp. JGD-17]|uniref:DUF4386 family protein n=2 Tax=Flagellimonas ochracea TaxID=2696472 RepID=A0A964TBB2_9FLAO|nr:DUF4386 family protein [Allomuricauda ochracea]
MALSVFGNLTISGIIAGKDYLPDVHAQQFSYSIATLALLFNSFGVLGIGLLSYSLLKTTNRTIARTYLVTRIFEGTVLAVGIIFLLSVVFFANQTNEAINEPDPNYYMMANYAIRLNCYSYHIAMATLGLGSIPFCAILLKHKIVPGFLSILGLIGYMVLAISSLVGLAGTDLGLLVAIPVFFFEVILGIWLIIKGIRPAMVERTVHS